MSCWYTRKEMALRCAILYNGQTLAFCVAGLIAAAVSGTPEGPYGLSGWQWLFIVLATTGAGLTLICLWLLVGMNIGISAAYGFSNFLPSIARGVNCSRVITLVLTAPPYIFAALSSLVNAWHSDKTKERGFHFAGPIAFGCIATSFAW